VKHLDDGIKKEKQAAISKGSFEQSQVFFKRSETNAATTMKLQDDVILREMNTKHENYINYIKHFNGKLCTSDINGSLFWWDLAGL